MIKNYKYYNVKKMANNKGITLIVLIITVIILIILGAVSINLALNDHGIFSGAKKSGELYEQQEKGDAADRAATSSTIQNSKNQGTDGTIADYKSSGRTSETSVILSDKFGNTLKLPIGFKIASDSADTIPGGVVIEDVSAKDIDSVGNQFVWVPVGTIYTENAKKKIQLGRYTFIDDDKCITNPTLETGSITGYIDGEIECECVEDDNSYFISSVDNNKGYYIGRYEAATTTKRTKCSDELTTVMEKIDVNQYKYNYVTEAQSLGLSQAMYNNQNYTSNLMNCYAYDTAINFLNLYNKLYYNISDYYCNIDGLIMNYFEWNIGDKVNNYENIDICRFLCNRICYSNDSIDNNGSNITFRPILYFK